MAMNRKREDQVDVLVVTAVKEEWDAVLAVDTEASPNSSWEGRSGAAGPEVLYRNFMVEGGELRIGVVQAFGMGRDQAAIAAAPLLERHPEIRCLAMCGVCAGRRGHVALGDVIIADRAWPYDAGKLKVTIDEQGSRIERFQGDMDLYRIHPPEWKQRAERFQIDPTAPWIKERPRSYEEQGDWVLERIAKEDPPTTHADRKVKCPNWRMVLEQLWKAKLLEEGELNPTDAGRKYIERRLILDPDGLPEPGPFKTIVGPIASGAPVVEDPTIFARLSDTQAMRKIVGLEMETSAILELAHIRKIPFAIVMKGVMDHADAQKSDNMKRFAARASAECLIAFIRKNLPLDNSHSDDAHPIERVFISYTHDSEQHEAKVLKLADQLYTDGVDVWIDRYDPPPLEGWQQWRERQLEVASKVIVICTQAYRTRYAVLHAKPDHRHQIIPVIFSQDEREHIPVELGNSPIYCLGDGYSALLKELPRSMRPLSPRRVQSLGEPDELRSAQMRSGSKPVTKTTKRVLIVAANRDGDEPLALGREIREITTALRHSSSPKFEVHILWAATGSDLRSELLRVKPHVLHFCGHGTSAGPILEHTERGQEALDGKALRNWLKIVLKGIELDVALLNFCDSQEMLDDLADVAPIIIGPVYRISDEHAIAFSAAFYTALAARANVSFSYYLAKSATEMTPFYPESAEPGSTRDLVPRLLESQSGPYGIRCLMVDEVPYFDGVSRLRRRAFAFFASEPDALDRLRLDRKLRKILEVFPKKASFRVEQRWATRTVDLLYTLMDTCPAVVHIVGHGTPAGEFMFEHDRHRKGAIAPSHSLARVLTAFRNHIQCIVLMFSYSTFIASELDDVLDCVVAVNGELSDSVSATFSNAFYQLIDDGRTYQDAFDAAVALLLSERAMNLISLFGRNLDGTVAGSRGRVGPRMRQ